MTISSTTTKNSYSGNGSTTAFTYGFYIPTSTDIQVIVRSSTGTETVKSEGTGSTNYSISGVGSSSGGTIEEQPHKHNQPTMLLMILSQQKRMKMLLISSQLLIRIYKNKLIVH